MKITSIKGASTSLCLIAAALLSVSASASSNAPKTAKNSFAAEHVNWVLPDIPQEVESRPQYDSDPQTRSQAASRLIERLGIPANQVARADRQHVPFASGKANVSDEFKAKLRSLVAGLGEHDKVIVTGYAGKNGITHKWGHELSMRRALATATIIMAANEDVPVRLDSTAHWAGDEEDAKRVDVFVIRGLQR